MAGTVMRFLEESAIEHGDLALSLQDGAGAAVTLVVDASNGVCAIAIEEAGEVLSPRQLDLLAQLSKRGVVAGAARCVEDVQELLGRLLPPFLDPDLSDPHGYGADQERRENA